MAEKKVASRQERLMFEQLIRQDMQNGIQRTISDNVQTPSNNNDNNIQNRNPNLNYTNQNGNYPKAQSPNSQNPNSNNQKINQSNNVNNGPKRTLAQKFNIRTNKGKRDAVWEQKRQLKFAKYEQLMQEEQQYFDRQLSPKMTPSEENRQINNYNNGGQYKKVIPNNQQRMSPQEQYQRGTPNQKIFSPQTSKQQQQFQRGTPSQPGMTPQGQYSGDNQNYAQGMNYRRTPSNDPRMNQEQQYQNSNRTPFNNNQRMSPQQQYQNGNNTPYNNQRMSPQQQYQNGNNTPYNNQRMSPQQQYQNGNNNTPYNNQRMSPQQQNQNGNGTPYNRQTPNNYNNDYNTRNSPPHYNQGRQSPNSNNNNYPSRTPQPQYNQSRNGMQNQYDNYNNNLKGTRTPFIDYKTGQNIYNPRGFTPGQNQYNDIPNRPPSRPFGEISFKGQNGNENLGGRGYSRQNYSNSDNYY